MAGMDRCEDVDGAQALLCRRMVAGLKRHAGILRAKCVAGRVVNGRYGLAGNRRLSAWQDPMSGSDAGRVLIGFMKNQGRAAARVPVEAARW